MEKTSKGIFEFLCSQMQKLDERKINVEQLKAQSGAAKQLNNLLKYELDRAKAVQKFKDISIREIEN
jgi:hypothetical protein